MEPKSTVLIVDDEADTREVLLQRLEASGMRVLTASNGHEGLQAIIESEPDMVFLDLQMPGKDGMEVLRDLRARKIQKAVVVMTAYASVDRAVEAMKMGAHDFLIKPFDFEHLQIICDDVLERERLRRDAAHWQECARKYLHQMYPPSVADDLVQGSLLPKHLECTMLFTDIAGFTRYASEHSPQQIADGVTKYFTLMHEVVVEAGGWVDNFLGDGMLVIFGIPYGSSTHARDAVRAAIMMEERLSASGSEMRHSIGINSGVVLVGNVGSDQKPHYSAIGEPVNIARRLVEIASPGEILIGEQTAQRVGDTASLEALGPIEVKGMERLRAFRIIGEE